ncbi:unnamed protein product [Prorocentrum cordatum]|uniref:Uncharacterized protein n=1 Tax=Prorocentrum cordatum TaxID=2364126 RepID=A0ABN9YKN0_9DINO|nr:unnamed protein product [Polarella glacialis]
MPQLDAAGVLQALEAREDTPGAQDGFDAGASVLLASLPPAPRRCPWGPLSWYAPVVHVKSLPSVNGADANSTRLACRRRFLDRGDTFSNDASGCG